MARQLISGCLQTINDMAGPMISGVLGQLGSAAYEMTVEEVKAIKDVEAQVEKLRSELTAIQAVLEDAEKRQFKEATVRDWLDKLKDVSHDIDDVLDEWITAINKANTEKGDKAGEDPSPSKRQCLSLSVTSSWITYCHELVLRGKIASRIKELNEKLATTADERSRYSFNTTSLIEEPERPKTTSFVNITNIRGRDLEKGLLISKLCESDQQSGRVEIIPIVGMGGIGKTTLAQLAYHDNKVQAYFEKVIWICVSEPFDEKRIAKAILEGLVHDAQNLGEMESLHRIHESVGGKRFLLILDDVWTEDDTKWEPLKEALNSGARESKILVTTRKKEVAIMMRAENNVITIRTLSDEICWSIFSQLAFSGRDRCGGLEDVGMKIAIKCKGLPLVAKILGSLMRCKRDIQQWDAVLHSEFWELEKDIHKNKIFAPFMLSYNDLPSVEKRCLLYCSIFPKDHVMSKDELIKLWMSQGYLGSENLEQEGQDCYDNLAMRSFFQDFEEDEVGNITSCKMHDIMHDFVQFLTRNECFIIEVGKKMESTEKKARHAALISDWRTATSDADTTLSSMCVYKGLRTLYVISEWSCVSWEGLYLNLTCLRTLNLRATELRQLPEGIGKLIHLRHLDLSENDDLEELPNSMCDLFNLQALDLKCCVRLEQLPKGMGKLVNLRHLCIRGCRLSQLPEGIGKLIQLRHLDLSCNFFLEELPNSMCDLFNLQTLNLKYCINLKQLPKGMGKLVNLRHLCIVGCGKLESLPKGIAKLSCLRTLDRFTVPDSDCHTDDEKLELQDLNMLEHLQELCILDCRRREDVDQAERASLKDKKYLVRLTLEFSIEITHEDVAAHAEILEALKPHPNLESLSILDYMGNTISPDWMMALINLKSLTLCSCHNCVSLPPLGKLPSLESLDIFIFSERLKSVGVEFLGIVENDDNIDGAPRSRRPEISFPKLKELKFKHFNGWEKWEGINLGEEEDNWLTIMPSIQSLKICCCPSLKALPDFLRKTPLQRLRIEFCPILKERCREGVGEDWPKISHIPNVKIRE